MFVIYYCDYDGYYFTYSNKLPPWRWTPELSESYMMIPPSPGVWDIE
jgi:hypothetical protein